MVVEAVFHFWPSLSKATTFHDWRAAERGEQAGARAQPRARALSPHGQPVRRAGSEKVFATRHRFEKTRKESQVKGSQNELGKIKGGPAQCGDYLVHIVTVHPHTRFLTDQKGPNIFLALGATRLVFYSFGRYAPSLLA